MTQKRRRPNNINKIKLKKYIISTKISPKKKSQQQQHQCICVTVIDFFFFFLNMIDCVLYLVRQ
jgi:hypothetical protein